MKLSIGVLLLLAACRPSPPEAPGLAQELILLREEVGRLKQELAKTSQPRLEAVEAMDDLAREVKRLTARIPPPAPSVPAPVPTVVMPVASLSPGGLQGGVGGTQPGINDLYWVLSKILTNGEERTVLCLYRAQADRRGFQLEDVRLLNFDQQIVELNNAHRPSVKEVQETLKRAGK